MRRLILEEPYSRAAIWSRRLAVFALFVAGVDCALSRAGAVEPAGALAVLGAGLVLACLAGLLSTAAAFVGLLVVAVVVSVSLAIWAIRAESTAVDARHEAESALVGS